MNSTRCSLKWNYLFPYIFYIKFLRHIVLQLLYLNTIFELFCGNLHRRHLIEKAHLVYNICLDRLYTKFIWHSLCWLHPFFDYSHYWRSLLDVFCHQVCHLVSKISMLYDCLDVHPIPMCSSFVWSKVWARVYFVFMITTEISADDWTQ